MGIALQDFRPIELGKAIGLALGLGGFVELREGVVLEDEPHAQTNQLLGEPVMTVDVDLERKRSPGLQANMDEAKLRIEEIVVEDALLAWPGDESRSLLARNECKGIAR